MDEKMVGKVTVEEKNELLTLYERKNGIEELLGTLESGFLNEEETKKLLDKMYIEEGKAKLQMQEWWENMYKKYNWESKKGMQWNIDFRTCDIYLSL